MVGVSPASPAGSQEAFGDVDADEDQDFHGEAREAGEAPAERNRLSRRARQAPRRRIALARSMV
jgi:hypothetical protein